MSKKRRPHVLIFAETFFPTMGGSERVAHNLALGLVEAGWHVTLFAPAMPGSAHFDRAQPYRIHRSRAWSLSRRIDAKARKPVARAARYSGILAAAVWMLLHRKDAVVSAHLTPFSIPAVLLRTLWRGPVLVWTHGEDLTVGARSPIISRQIRACLRASSRVVSNCRTTARRVREFGVAKERIVIQYPCPDASFFAPLGNDRAALRKHEGVGDGSTLLLATVTRLVERKGIDTVLRALAAALQTLKDSGQTPPHWRYLVGGTGEYLPRLRRLSAELGLAGNVAFIGALSEPEKRNLIEAADLFPMPNREMPNGEIEGFGIVFLEAALRGTPCIAGRSGGAPEAVEEGVSGWVIDSHDHAALAELLVALFRDPAPLAAMRASAREWAVTRFTASLHQEPVRAALEKLMGR